MKKTLIFHIGHSAGFYSEYNNMVLAILHCKKYHIDFKLYSEDANFGLKNGWTDFFLTFCNEVTDDFHHIYNKRFPEKLQTVYLLRWIKSICRAIKHFDKSLVIPYYSLFYDTKKIRILKRKYHFNYFTYDLLYDFRRWNGALTIREVQLLSREIVENTILTPIKS